MPSLIVDTKESLWIFLIVNIIYPVRCEGLVTSPTGSTVDLTYLIKDVSGRAFIEDL